MTLKQSKLLVSFVLAFGLTFLVTMLVAAKPPLQEPGDKLEQVDDLPPEEESVEQLFDDQARQLTASEDLIDRLPVQGLLTDSAGQPLVSQAQNVTFNLYEAVDEIDAICTSTATVTTDANGFFNSFIEGCATELGNDRAIDGQQLYLGIQVGSDTEMTPRRPLYPVPYAIAFRPGAAVRGEVDTQEGTLFVTNNARNEQGFLRGAIYGWSTSGSRFGYGMYGRVQNPDGYGVFGRADESLGRGVFGWATQDEGVNYGVYGRTESPSGRGTLGFATSSTGRNYGVFGQSNSTEGIGVYGIISRTSGINYGVYGESRSSSGYGVYGNASSISATTTYGVYGTTSSNGGFGVYGTAIFTGVAGVVTTPVAATTGVHGKTASPDGRGVYGQNTGGGVGVMAYSASGRPIEAYGRVLTEPVFYVANEGDVYAAGAYNCGGTITETVTVIVAMTGTITATNGMTNTNGMTDTDTMTETNGMTDTMTVRQTMTDTETMTPTTNMMTNTVVITTITRNGLAPCLRDSNEADFAEMLPTAYRGLEPGDVLAIDERGELVRSDEPYQPTVVGVYSTQPSYLGNSRHWGQADYAPLALVGIVPVKATALNGAIQPGDMLTASSIPGHAMRADRDAPNGTIIGKALAGLDSGGGVIRMLVMLQ